MKKQTPEFTITILALACVVLFGCNAKQNANATDHAQHDNASHPADTSIAEASATESAKNSNNATELPVLGKIADFKLLDQDSNSFTGSNLDNAVTIANFFFSACTATCPEQTQKLTELQRTYSDRTSVRFLSISVQPEVDTPETLRNYARQHRADTKQWSFVTGDRHAIWKLSKEQFMLPVGDAPDNQGMPIFHSPKFVLIDGQRQIRGYFESSSASEISQLKKRIEELTSARPQSPVINSDDEATQELENKLTPNSLKNVNKATQHHVYVPSERDVNPDWMAARAEAQLATREQFKVLHDFKFQDTCRESGINWEATIVADAGKEYVAAHYDHGNGIAVADVDGDDLLDIYLTSQIGSNALFKNLGGGKFENVTEKAGVGLADRIGVAASFADYDNDGDADLFVTTVRGGNALFRNDGGWKFTDVSGEMRLDYVGHSSAAVFFDFDRDGWLDLFVTNVGKYTVDEQGPGGYYRSLSQAFSGHLRNDLTETSILFKNIEGKRFEDVTEAMQLVDDSWSGAATPIDANEDGWIDLYTCDMQGHDEYFENQQGKGFKKRSREVFPKTPWGAMGVKVFDFDNDGMLDLYITDMHSDMSEHVGIDKEKLKANMQWPESMLRSGGQSIWGNALFRKTGPDTYEEVSDAMGAENYWPWGHSVGDLNADGWTDAFVASSMNLPLRYGVNSVLLNNKGKKFLDSEFVLGVEPRRDNVTGKVWFTLDCDGEDRSHKYAKQAGITSGKISVWSALGSRSSAIFDMDNDGDLDIITNDFNSPPMVLTSNLAQKHEIKYLKVKLIGTASNKDGLGATVRLATGQGTQTKVHDGQSGYMSQSSKELYFGLGDEDKVDQIEVTWPSGKKQRIECEKINTTLTITEG